MICLDTTSDNGTETTLAKVRTVPTVNGVSLADALRRFRFDHARQKRETERQIRSAFRSARAIERAGLRSSFSANTECGIDIRGVTRESLPTLRKALGPMRVSHKSVLDPRKRTVRVHLRFADHPHVSASYEKTLPKRTATGPAPKCRIVRQTSRYYALVCDRA